MQTLRFTLQGISVQGTIIDIETVSLNPKPNGLFTLGTLSGSTIRIIQAENEADCETLKAEIRKVWETLPQPIYVYNRNFVSGWISQALEEPVLIDHDTMQTWKDMADQQSLKWPRLRELVRPPVFYYQWGIADYDRERDRGAIRRAVRRAKSVNEIISWEALGGAPHIWWQQHLNMVKDPEIARLLAHPPSNSANQTDKLHRLPNGSWTTRHLAAIVCHNMMDLQSQASLLLWQWNATSSWL